jgi:hypothetical protein
MPLCDTLLSLAESEFEGDRHVLAAAIATQADYIVTQNLRHFPAKSLEPFGIRSCAPDEFLLEIWNGSRSEVAHIIVNQAHSLRRPQMTPRAVLRALARHAPTFSQAIINHLETENAFILDYVAPGVAPEPPGSEA